MVWKTEEDALITAPLPLSGSKNTQCLEIRSISPGYFVSMTSYEGNIPEIHSRMLRYTTIVRPNFSVSSVFVLLVGVCNYYIDRSRSE